MLENFESEAYEIRLEIGSSLLFTTVVTVGA